MEYQSNTYLFEAIKQLKDSLSSSGNEDSDELIAEGMSSLNGLTDGWALLLESINTVIKNHSITLSEQQNVELNKIRSEVHKIVYRA